MLSSERCQVDLPYGDGDVRLALPAGRTVVVETFFLKPLTDLRRVEAMVADAGSVVVLPQATLTLPLLPGQEEVGF